MNNITYKSVLESIYNRHQKEIKYNLKNIQKLDAILDYPSKSFKSIHIAGTNGKGSVGAILHSIYTANGFTTGLLTSPHLVHLTERIRINNKDILQDEIIKLYIVINNALKRSWGNKSYPTFFEYMTAMAFLHFRRRKVDIAIIEVGLGGRLDATNIITPEVAIITNIDFDHKKTLGDTLEKIALEKAGVIKNDVPVVIGEKRKGLRKIFEKIAQEKKSEIHFTNETNFKIKRKSQNLHRQKLGIEFKGKPLNLEFPLTGDHQLDNLNTALTAMNILNKKEKLPISTKNLRVGIRQTRWFGRNEIIHTGNPIILIDAAHNKAGFIALKEYLEQIFDDFEEKVLVIGILRDKLCKKELIDLAKLFDRVYVVLPVSERALNPDVLVKLFEPYVPTLKVTEDLTKYKTHLGISVDSQHRKTIVVNTGSVYFVGYMRERIKQKNLYLEVQ